MLKLIALFIVVFLLKMSDPAMMPDVLSNPLKSDDDAQHSWISIFLHVVLLFGLLLWLINHIVKKFCQNKYKEVASFDKLGDTAIDAHPAKNDVFSSGFRKKSSITCIICGIIILVLAIMILLTGLYFAIVIQTKSIVVVYKDEQNRMILSEKTMEIMKEIDDGSDVNIVLTIILFSLIPVAYYVIYKIGEVGMRYYIFKMNAYNTRVMDICEHGEFLSQNRDDAAVNFAGLPKVVGNPMKTMHFRIDWNGEQFVPVEIAEEEKKVETVEMEISEGEKKDEPVEKITE